MEKPDRSPGSTTTGDRVRFDKWLWAARFYKTRSLAAQAIDTGAARLDDARVKPAHAVRIGDTIGVRKQGTTWTVTVTGLSERRGGAADAATLYVEAPESVARRNEEALQRRAAAAGEVKSPGRPTKRNRRKLADFLNEP